MRYWLLMDRSQNISTKGWGWDSFGGNLLRKQLALLAATLPSRGARRQQGRCRYRRRTPEEAVRVPEEDSALRVDDSTLLIL